MIEIRPFRASDVPLGMRLKDQAGWNQTEADWHRFLFLEPEGCFVAEWEGRAVGTTVACIFGGVGWVAMVLVDREVRSRGIGSRMVEHALAYLDGRGVRSVRLDATPLGRPVYEKFGFRAEYELLRLEGRPAPQAEAPGVVPLAPEHLEELCRLDRTSVGIERRRLLESLHADWPEASRVVVRGGAVAGYALLRRGSRAVYAGPIAACDPEAGRAVADAALAACGGRLVFVDVPVGNGPAVEWAEAHGLAPQRGLIRMCRGEPLAGRSEWIWSSAGAELG